VIISSEKTPYFLEADMDKKIAGLLGAAAAIATASSAYASTQSQTIQVTAPASYRDLLEPIPNALAALKADDAARARQAPARVQLAQFHHHHHHHHHGFFPGFGLGLGLGLLGAAPYYAPPPEYCHWVYGRPYWNGYRWVHPLVRVCD
jgi:hypothetical protein